MEKNVKVLGTYLKACRLRLGYTQKQVTVAARLGKSPQILWNIENGHTTLPVEYIRPLARLYKVKEQDLRKKGLENDVVKLKKKWGLA